MVLSGFVCWQRLIGSLWWRISYRCQFCPWALWTVVDESTPRHQREAIVRRLLNNTCPECYDAGFTAKVIGKAVGPECLLDPASPLATSVREAFQRCRSTNILSETRFARIASQLWSSKKGRSSALTSMSSKNFLAEMKHQHGQSIVQWNRKYGRGDEADLRAVATAPTTSPKAVSAWHLFLADHRAHGGSNRPKT